MDLIREGEKKSRDRVFEEKKARGITSTQNRRVKGDVMNLASAFFSSLERCSCINLSTSDDYDNNPPLIFSSSDSLPPSSNPSDVVTGSVAMADQRRNVGDSRRRIDGVGGSAQVKL